MPGDGKASTHQRFVFTDPVAFRYLLEDPTTQVLVQRSKLEGYETYLVEQWACSRTHPTFIIATYTGDPKHEITCDVLSVPMNEDLWSPRLKIYFQAIREYHARPRETKLGTLWITNLSAFPSSLTVISVPEGDPQKYREVFFVNENLKRLGCSGRTGMSLAKPASATVSKFYQLYRASEKIPVGQAVIELVKLCQVALMLFDKLEPEYCDGLLCDMTEKALNDWWVEFGTEYYNIEPHDGILGPTTVAALMGLLMGARNRLQAYGAPAPKDVFDIEHTKRAIAYFQKFQHLTKTRRLDHATLSRLHRTTAKAANSEGWIVPRAIKGTVAELGGKGGEMMIDLVGTRNKKSGIADVESADIEQFINAASGGRAKWLWFGKARKGQTSGDMFNRLAVDSPVEFKNAEGGGYEWSTQRKDSTAESPNQGLFRSNTIDSVKSQATTDGRHRSTRKHGSDKDLAHKDHDSIRRIKDAVSLRHHGSFRHTKDEQEHDSKHNLAGSPRPSPIPEVASPNEEYFSHSHNHVGMPDGQILRNPMFDNLADKVRPSARNDSSTFLAHVEQPSDEDEKDPVNNMLGAPIQFSQSRTERSSTASLQPSLYNGVDLDNLLPVNDVPDHNVGPLLRRRHSLQSFSPFSEQRSSNYWPRRVSFSIASDAVLRWDSINKAPRSDEIMRLPNPTTRLIASKVAAQKAQLTRNRLLAMENSLYSWVDSSVSNVNRIINLVRRDQDTLDGLYYPRLEEYHALEAHSHGVHDEQKDVLVETVREIEVMGARLDYEINALRSKVEEVEDGVGEFELQVKGLEARVAEMEEEFRPREGWLHWIMRLTIGVGEAPEPGKTNGAPK